jgi:hypothetical protein
VKTSELSISSEDRTRLRDLAKRVAEIAALPVQAERRRLWFHQNRLERTRPLILVFPEGGERELLPPSILRCEGEAARRIEYPLRRRIYFFEHLHDDKPVEREWVVHKVVHNSGWGLEPRWIASDDPTGAKKFDPVLRGPEDLKKLRRPRIEYDPDATERDLAEAEELLGDILDVRLKGVDRVHFHPMRLLSDRRDLGALMMDMAANPGFVHDAMAILEDGYRGMVDQYVEQDLLDLNNDATYTCSGGVGYTDELPQPDFDGEHVRPCDMWTFAEAQELALVSPEMHEEFALQYERRLLEPFGLTTYGCCEDLTRKLDSVLAVPNMRRISISPFADVEACADRLEDKCILSWKPHPSYLVGEFHPDKVRTYLRRALDTTRGCVMEMVLKDTHTCEHHPERFTIWTDIAQELAREYA